MITSDSFENGGAKPNPDKKAKKKALKEVSDAAKKVVAEMKEEVAPVTYVTEEEMAKMPAPFPPEPGYEEAPKEYKVGVDFSAPVEDNNYCWDDVAMTRVGTKFNSKGQRAPGSGYR